MSMCDTLSTKDVEAQSQVQETSTLFNLLKCFTIKCFLLNSFSSSTLRGVDIARAHTIHLKLQKYFFLSEGYLDRLTRRSTSLLETSLHKKTLINTKSKASVKAQFLFETKMLT